MSWDVDVDAAQRENPDADAFAGPWWWHYLVLLPGLITVVVLFLGKGLPA